ncbi:hypothetical protein AX16_009261 [Volvariella volvacea WC 439]|nr:hypothetical protein AX16_009261 [Volvariella volvacea WC 439]
MEDCPDDVLFVIKDHLDGESCWKELLALRLASRRLHTFFTPFAVNRPLQFIWDISENLQLPIDGGPRFLVGRRGMPQDPLFVPAPDAFLPFISTLSVEFAIHCKSEDIPASPEEVIHSLSSFWVELLRYKALRSLDYDQNPVSASIPEILPPFRAIQDLHISISNVYKNALQGPTPPSLIGNLIINNPALHSVFLRFDSGHPVCKFEELFPVGLKEWTVRKHHIYGMLPNAPYTHYPLMRNLQDVNLIAVHAWQEDIDGFWLALKASGARLKEISINYGISEALMAYLASYEGLKKLKTLATGYSSLSPLSTSFASKVLSRHARSLTRITIGFKAPLPDNYGRPLAIYPYIWPNPTAFLHLDWLVVPAPPTWEIGSRTIQCLLDYTSQCPNLQKLIITWMEPTSIPTRAAMLSVAEEVWITKSALSTFASFIIPVSRGHHGIRWEIVWEGEETRSQLSRFKMVSYIGYY